MLSAIFFGLAHVSNILFNLMMLLILVAVAASWFQMDTRNPMLNRVLYMSELLCRPFRPLARKIPGPFDFAPFFAMLVITFAQKAVPAYLMSLSYLWK